MSPPLVLLAHAPSAEERAAEIAVQLAALGYTVDAVPDAPRARNARLNAAHRLIVLWSRDAAKSPALRTLARLARGSGKLACVRLDATKPPPGLCSELSIRLPRGRAQSGVWRRILNDAPARGAASPSTAKSAAGRTSRVAGVGAALVMGFMVAFALYLADANFASRVNDWAEQAHTRAGAIVENVKTQ